MVDAKELENLKKLTSELNNEILSNHPNGVLWNLLIDYFNTFNTLIVIIRADKRVLYMNDSTKVKIKEVGYNPDVFIDSPCIGELQEKCILSDDCPLEECIETKSVVVRTNVKSPISDNRYNLVCMPLLYNGVSAVIEMWVDV